MKKFINTWILILIFLFAGGCTLIVPGVIAVDNTINKGANEIEVGEVVKLEKNSNVLVVFDDSTKITGQLYAIERDVRNRDMISKLKIHTEDEKKIIINTNDIDKLYFVEEGGSIWVGAALGAAIDVIVFLLISSGDDVDL